MPAGSKSRKITSKDKKDSKKAPKADKDKVGIGRFNIQNSSHTIHVAYLFYYFQSNLSVAKQKKSSKGM